MNKKAIFISAIVALVLLGLAGLLFSGVISLRPKTAFLKMVGGTDGAWTSMYDMLNAGQLEMLEFQQKAAELFDPFAEKYHKELGEWSGEKAKWMTIRSASGNVEVTPAMAISLYLHSLNDQNMRHIETGIKIPDKKLYSEGKVSNAYDRGRRVSFAKSDIAEAYKSFTPAMKEYAELAHKFFNEMAKDAINKTSVALDGYEKALVENYFPIKTDSNFTVKNIDSLVRDITIEGWKNLEARTDAKNPAVLEDINNVVTRHINATSKYAGLAIPIHNFNGVYNGMSAQYKTSVKEQLRQKWEDQASKYVEKLLTDLQAGSDYAQDPISKALRAVRGLSAQAVLSANIGVSMKQVASLPTAASKLGFDSILHGMKKANEDIINKYTPLMWYRSIGNIDTAYSEATKAKGGLNKLPKTARQVLGLTWIQSFDRWAVNRIWSASEYWVEQHRPSLVVGTDEYYREVARVFNDTVEGTQPNYTTMQRPQILRSDSELIKSVTMYQTQRLQNYNIAYEDIVTLRNAKAEYKANPTPQNKAKVTKATKNLARSSASLVSAALMIGAIEALTYGIIKRKRDEIEDEDGNVTLGKVTGYVAKKTTESLIGNVLFGAELESLLLAATGNAKWYEVDVGGVSQINDFATAFVNWTNALSAYSGDVIDELSKGTPINEINQTVYNGTVINRTTKLAKALATLFGIPYNNIETVIGNGIAYANKEFAAWWDNRNSDTENAWKIRKAGNLSVLEYTEYAAAVAQNRDNRKAKAATNEDKARAIAAQNWTDEQKEAVWEEVRGTAKTSLAAANIKYAARGDNDSLSQEELYTYLNGSNTKDKNAIWEELFPKAKTSYSEYKP